MSFMDLHEHNQVWSTSRIKGFLQIQNGLKSDHINHTFITQMDYFQMDSWTEVSQNEATASKQVT